MPFPPTNRRVCIAHLIGLATASAGLPAAAQAGFPVKPLKLVVAFPPAGAADLSGRLIAQAMSESLGQPVVVENKPGANGAIGADFVAKASPDGHTLLLIDRGALAISPHINRSLGYDSLTSFAYVGMASMGPYVLVVDPALGVKNIPDLIDLARRQPLSYASFGPGSLAHYNLEDLAAHTGIKLHHVPYRGSSAAVQAILKKEVALTIAAPPAVLELVADGRLQALAVGSATRLQQMPNVPTVREAGGIADTLVPTYFVLAAPTGTPVELMRRLNDEMKRAVARPAVAEILEKNGLLPHSGSPEEVTAFVRRDVARFGERIRAIGLKVE